MYQNDFCKCFVRVQIKLIVVIIVINTAIKRFFASRVENVRFLHHTCIRRRTMHFAKPIYTYTHSAQKTVLFNGTVTLMNSCNNNNWCPVVFCFIPQTNTHMLARSLTPTKCIIFYLHIIRWQFFCFIRQFLQQLNNKTRL